MAHGGQEGALGPVGGLGGGGGLLRQLPRVGELLDRPGLGFQGAPAPQGRQRGQDRAAPQGQGQADAQGLQIRVQAQQGDVDADDPGNPAGAIPEGSETAEEGSPAIGVGIPADGDLSAAKGFPQVRLGWMGRRFRLWKFRSMVVNAEALRGTVQNEASGAFFKNKNDPRITRVGRFLRKTSLDEIPQFWNVLVGDMSLIGTRPPTPDEVDRYAVPNWQRLDVRPGLSGEWQVNGRSQVLDFEDVIRLDLRYQENWSLGYDLKLIVRTFTVIFSKGSGAA
jgi:lipopolysaccharide/colanic/teichoic acid biosynthesis glycosyltransferase